MGPAMQCRDLAVDIATMQHLFTVSDRFQIEGLGCVLVPGLSSGPGSPTVKRGARIRLRMPGGSESDTSIESIEHIRYREMPERITFPILLPKEFTKEQVPVGTEVFLLE